MSAFENIAKSFSNNLVLISDEGARISYGQLEGISKQFKDNIPARSLVFSLNKNTPGSFVGYYSFMTNKVVPLMLEAKIDFELLNKLIAIYEPEYIWLPTEAISKVQQADVVFNLFDYSLLKLRDSIKIQPIDDLAMLLTTSGSTGSPKLVKLTYENLRSNAFSIIDYLSIDQNERPITTLPMSYSFGLSIINSHIYKGATILLTERTLFERGFWAFLKEQMATSLSGVPYTFEMLKKLRFSKMDLPSLITLTQAGGKMNLELNKEFAEFCAQANKRLFVMYGQTEATARMSFLPPEHSLSKLGSVGKAIPGGEFSLINENGNVITDQNVAGELVYNGPNVSLGYAESKSDLMKPDENKGKLVTGDLAKRDDDGYYYIVGRKKRFIKIFGNRVNLDETEHLLKNILLDCACVGEDDKMIIYICDTTPAEEVRSFISNKMGIHHTAFSVKYIDTIPKNSSGKTVYTSLMLGQSPL